MGYGLHGQDPIPVGVRDFVHSLASRPAPGLVQPPLQWEQGAPSLEVKRQEREADH
jgi:hypothetical protein